MRKLRFGQRVWGNMADWLPSLILKPELQAREQEGCRGRVRSASWPLDVCWSPQEKALQRFPPGKVRSCSQPHPPSSCVTWSKFLTSWSLRLPIWKKTRATGTAIIYVVPTVFQGLCCIVIHMLYSVFSKTLQDKYVNHRRENGGQRN